MTNQSPRIYTYKITFEEVPHYYYGVHKEDKFDEYYMGSPYTHKWMWDFYTPQKQVLELFNFSDDGYKEAGEIEKRLIGPVYNTDPLCLNENCGGVISLEVLRASGKKSGQKHYENGTGLFKLTREQHSEKSKRVAQKNKENGVAIFAMTREEKSEAGRKGGQKTYELGIGVHGRTEEKIKEDCSKAGKIGGKIGGKIAGKISGKKHKENGTGIFKMTPEQKSEAGKKGGRKTYENGTGCFKIPPEERREIGRRGAQVQHSQKWQCTKTGYVSTPAGLSNYQKARGINTSNRIRLQ